MRASTFRIRSVLMLAAFLGGSLLPEVRGATWYVDQAAPPSGNGTSRATAWNSFAAINQASLAGGDTVLVYPGTYDERFTLSKSGSSVTNRINFKGVGRPVLRCVAGGSRSNIAVIGFEFTQPTTNYTYSAITMAGG